MSVWNCQVRLQGRSQYLSFVPPTGRVWNKDSFSWVWAQGPFCIPLKKKRQAINLGHPRRVRAWGYGPQNACLTDWQWNRDTPGQIRVLTNTDDRSASKLSLGGSLQGGLQPGGTAFWGSKMTAFWGSKMPVNGHLDRLLLEPGSPSSQLLCLNGGTQRQWYYQRTWIPLPKEGEQKESCTKPDLPSNH